MDVLPEGRIDPSVVVPEAVRAASAAVEKYYQPQEVPPEGEATNVEAQAQPEPQADPPPQAEPPVEVTPTGKVDNGTWEQRYLAMKGRYDRSVEDNRALQDTNRQLSDRIRQLETLLATNPMRVASADTGTTSTVLTDDEIQSLITDEERQVYGDDMLEVVAKKVREVAEPRISRLQKDIENLRKTQEVVAQTFEMSARDKMFSQLDTSVPQWRELNSDQQFLAWLQLPDVLSGAIRQDLLNDAVSRHDAYRAQQFFKGFLAEKAAVDPARGGNQAVTGSDPSPKVDLATLAAPGRAKTAPGTTDGSAAADKPIITRQQIAQFYADCTSGKYKGRDADREATERAIFLAQAEGRVR